MKILKWFKKKKTYKNDPYSTMGALGVSPEYLNIYNDAVNQIKNSNR